MIQLMGRGRGGGGSQNYYEAVRKRKSQQQMPSEQQMINQTPTGQQLIIHDTQNLEMEQPNIIGNESDFYDDGEYLEVRGAPHGREAETTTHYIQQRN